MKTTVIHHSADYDGIFCREIARHFIPDAEFIGWDYKDPKLEFPTHAGLVYVMDLSPDCFTTMTVEQAGQVIWIDHHKSAIEKYANLGGVLRGYRIDGVAACRLAWQWFSKRFEINPALPALEDFKSRLVNEPMAVRLAGEYDVWYHRGDGDEAFQFGLDAQKEILWNELLKHGPPHRNLGFSPLVSYALKVIDDGKSAMACYAKRDADVMRERSFIQKFEGLKFLALNTVRCNSKTFTALDIPETGHDALMAFFWNGYQMTVSMYHAAHRTDIDLSQIASKYGGGGHRGACGFGCAVLPFDLI